MKKSGGNYSRWWIIVFGLASVAAICFLLVSREKDAPIDKAQTVVSKDHVNDISLIDRSKPLDGEAIQQNEGEHSNTSSYTTPPPITIVQNNESEQSEEDVVSTDFSEPDGEALNPEVIATRRMILAHAPLRVPSVDDPDSEENKEILQSMIFKALQSPKPQASSN